MGGDSFWERRLRGRQVPIGPNARVNVYQPNGGLMDQEAATGSLLPDLMIGDNGLNGPDAQSAIRAEMGVSSDLASAVLGDLQRIAAGEEPQAPGVAQQLGLFGSEVGRPHNYDPRFD